VHRLAVTGASGFVGRQVVNLAVAERHEVMTVVRNPVARDRLVAAGARPILVETFTAAALADAFAGCDAVVHLANIGAERGSETYETVNVQGTATAAEAARTAGVRRFVYFSGLGVAHYGMTRHTTNGYFLSKLRAETRIFEAVADAVVFRPSYILGPGDGLITQLLRDIAAGEVEMPGDGRYRAQPLAVRDAAAAVLAALHLTDTGHRVFDLVGEQPIAYRDFLGLVFQAAQATPRMRETSLEGALLAARAGGYRGMHADELACLLCDEVADPRPLQSLLGGFGLSLEEAVRVAVRGTRVGGAAGA
jgi:nucleoside-diphosphate-sugar epimerase